jgi:hypothetical protein
VATESCTLPSKASEEGTWAVSISAGMGMPQVQALGTVSYPIRLKPEAKIETHYRSGQVAEEPERPCLGAVNEPLVEPGYLCVYRGLAFGREEKQHKKAHFVKFETPQGRQVETETGASGELIVFRAPIFGFKEEGTTPETLKAQAYLSAGGTWAVTER